MKGIRLHGINLFTLLYFANRRYKYAIALVDDTERITFKQLYNRTIQTINYLIDETKTNNCRAVGITCSNHISQVVMIFAASRLGYTIYLLNAQMSSAQLQQLVQDKCIELIICDQSTHSNVKNLPVQLINCERINITNVQDTIKHPRNSKSSFSLLTSGSTGKPKEAVHQPSLYAYLNPFLALVTKLKLIQHSSCYIATPIYHGYGFAMLMLYKALGKKIFITRKFNAKIACEILHKERIEMMCCVPVIINRLMNEAPQKLHSLKCIASGGAPLPAQLVKQINDSLGAVLYNLYGTSETGLNIIGTAEELKDNPNILGKIIKGIDYKIIASDRPAAPFEIGILHIRSESAMASKKLQWQQTDDLVYEDSNGYIYYVGRADDMIISGGINVYPKQLEDVLLQHDAVEDAAVIGMQDLQFGQRLYAFIQLKQQKELTEGDLQNWLNQKIARYEKPKKIYFMDEMPYSMIGKKDKKNLKLMLEKNGTVHM